MPATISTSRTVAGLKKCTPSTRSERWHAAPIDATDSDDVFVASAQAGDTTRSSA
jgi:hypothetical protein